MLLDLICFDCIKEQIDKGVPNTVIGEPIPTPFEPINDSGIYQVHCVKGHEAVTIIDNVDFEILFEYSLNAIADRYYREAVSSSASAMERYFEFFVKVVLRSTGAEFSEIDRMWRNLSAQSERQLGAYIALYFNHFGVEPPLLDPNKGVSLRNSVIHKGYVPSEPESIAFANAVMRVIETSLIKLKNTFPTQTNQTFEYCSYRRKAEEQIKNTEKATGKKQNGCCVNIMTTIDVMHGRELNDKDGRKGSVEVRIPNILKKREPRRLTLLKDKPEQM